MWGTVGVRRLIAGSDGVTSSSNVLGQNDGPMVRGSSAGGWQPTTAVLDNPYAALMPLPALWDTEHDTALDQSGSDLLEGIGWDLPPQNSAPANEHPVSLWWEMLPAALVTDTHPSSSTDPSLLSNRVSYNRPSCMWPPPRLTLCALSRSRQPWHTITYQPASSWIHPTIWTKSASKRPPVSVRPCYTPGSAPRL